MVHAMMEVVKNPKNDKTPPLNRLKQAKIIIVIVSKVIIVQSSYKLLQ